MSDLARATAAPFVVTIGGKDYTAAQLTLGDIATIQQHLSSRKTKRFFDEAIARASASGTPANVAKYLVDSAVEQFRKTEEVDLEQAIDWAFGSIEGLAFALWLMLKKNHADAFADPAALTAELLKMTPEQQKTLVSSTAIGTPKDTVGFPGSPAPTAS